MSISIYLQHDRAALLVAADCLQENGFAEQAAFLRDRTDSCMFGCCYFYYQSAPLAIQAGLGELYQMAGKSPVPAGGVAASLETGLGKLLQMGEQYKEDNNWKELVENVGRLLYLCRKYPSAALEART